MKKLRVIVCFLLVAIICLTVAGNQASAHNVKQTGTLLEEYISSTHGPLYGKSFVGGETIGWSINEDHHLANAAAVVTFAKSAKGVSIPNNIINLIIEGANKWDEYVSWLTPIAQIYEETGFIPHVYGSVW